MYGALRIIYRAEGPRGLCRGLIPTLFRDAPFSGLYLMFYTQTKQAIPPGKSLNWYKIIYNFLTILTSNILNFFFLFVALLDGSTASPIHFTCGIIAGILASLVTQPADVIKTKMQVYPEEFKNVKSAILHIQKVNFI